MAELWERLQVFGLSQYEARTYVAAVQFGKSSAYQLSKASGVPRARVYDVLNSLVDRGIVMLEEDDEGNKAYLPLPVDVFLDRVQRQWESAFDKAGSELKQLESCDPTSDVYVATVRGEQNVLSFCRMLLKRAKARVLLSMWRPMYNRLLPELQAIHQTGCSIKGIVIGVDEPIGDLYAHRMNEYMYSIDKPWFILAIDGKELLYGHSVEANGNAFYTDDPVHLYLLEDYIWHDVLVNRLVQQGGEEQLDGWILPERARFFDITD